ncbi:hypothetical protein [uncultured Aquimarina sp.]|uniref:hypothetical protein n=1 Tax=uncultured Aquimarina sp. TaxID=575652 RepID=UPI00262EE6A2|nr:hypothetical protein [uncultured Aquimarina sp.]
MKKTQKKHIKIYYGITLLLNFIAPTIVAISVIGDQEGEIQMGYIIVGLWGFICAILYGFYFAIPEFNKNWEKIAGLIFPSIILSLLLFEFPDFTIAVILNLIMTGIFVWQFKKNLLTRYM